MESNEGNVGENPVPKRDIFVLATQICFRIIATATAMASACLMFTAKQTVEVLGMSFDAKYSYSSAFKFLAIANSIACCFTFLSLLFMFFARHGLTATIYFFFFLHDLLMMSLVLSGVSAGTAFGLIGKYGNSHTGWLKICDRFEKYCNQITNSLVLSYVALLFFLLLTLISASKSRQII